LQCPILVFYVSSSKEADMQIKAELSQETIYYALPILSCR